MFSDSKYETDKNNQN